MSFTHLLTPAIALNKDGNLSSVEAVKFIMSEKEKYANDKQLVKNLFNYYESLGLGQVAAKDKEIRKLWNLAYGVIDPLDYVEEDESYGVTDGERLAVNDLDFYPIIPTLVHGIVGSHDKSYNEYTVQAVNPEVTNDILDKLNNDLRSILVQNVEALFEMENANSQEGPDVVAQKREMRMQSEEVQKFYTRKFRSSVEQWATHTMNMEDPYFNMKSIESRLLEQMVVTEDPILHIDYRDGNYKPEVLRERDTYSLRSTDSRDYSDSAMFGYFEYMTFVDILNKEASRLTDDQVKKISSWSNRTFGQNFTVNGHVPYFHKNQALQESRQNWETAEMLTEMLTERFRVKEAITATGYSPDLVRVTTQYFYIPRRVGILSVITKTGEMPPELVDEQYKTTIPAIYEEGKKKTADTLIYGEHIDWFYKPELWRGKKISTQTSRPQLPGEETNANIKESEVWLELDRHDIQYSDPHERYGLYIPVHGGPITNQYNDSASIVKLAAPWQVKFNWVNNRNKQLLATEIGKFFMLPEALVPRESLGGEWETDSLTKFATTARDVGMVGSANPSTNAEGPVGGIQGQYGQVVDLTKTQEIAEKVNLASLFKMECYQAVGLTPEFLYGDFAPAQSAKSVAMGQQRSATQLQHLLTRLNDIMVKGRTTMLETAKFIAAKSPTVEMIYTNSQEDRVIFKTDTMEFPLAKLGVMVKSNGSDLATIESIKNYVASNNTLGADSLELATLLSFKSLPEVFTKLKDIQDTRKAEKQKEFEQQKQLQEQQLAAQQAAIDKQIVAQEKEKALDREAMIMKAQISALGYAEGSADDIQRSILDLQTANARQEDLYARASLGAQVQASKERNLEQGVSLKQRQAQLNEQVALKQLAQKDRELDIQEKEIAARNARTKTMD